jgi:hypothetical protein
MSNLEKTGELIIDEIKHAGHSGISVTELQKRMGGDCDVETWISTLIKNKVIDVIGKTSSGARILRYIP